MVHVSAAQIKAIAKRAEAHCIGSKVGHHPARIP
jgi:hypothetical protein